MTESNKNYRDEVFVVMYDGDPFVNLWGQILIFVNMASAKEHIKQLPEAEKISIQRFEMDLNPRYTDCMSIHGDACEPEDLQEEEENEDD